MDYSIFNVRIDVDACNCTRECTDTVRESAPNVDIWEKNPLPHRGIELASAACRSDAVPTELHPRPMLMYDRSSDVEYRDSVAAGFLRGKRPEIPMEQGTQHV